MQKAKSKQPASSSSNTLSISNSIPKDIDPDVFDALPADIRNEILQAHSERIQNPTRADMPPQPLTNSNSSILNESDFQPTTSKAAELKKQCKELQKLQKKQESHLYKYNSPKMSHIDPEFLAALPQELRMEVEKEYAQLPGKCEPADLKKKPSTKTRNNSDEYRRKISVDNIFMQVNCKEMILAWLKSADIPETYDVDLIAKHAEELVYADEIDTLYTPLIYLCRFVITAFNLIRLCIYIYLFISFRRLINHQKSSGIPSDCVWHKAYHDIIKVVQKRMAEAYNGRSLLLGAKLKCDKCENSFEM